jgi:hypothetical protein
VLRAHFIACDAVVTGEECNGHIWKGTGGNSIFDETASDALSSSSKQWKVVHFDALKIRRYLVPWGFNSPLPAPAIPFCFESLTEVFART